MTCFKPLPIIAVLAAGLFACTSAQAQMSNMLQGAMGGGGASSGGGMMGSLGSMGSGMGLPSVGAASPNNLAGLLQYCVQNNYLGGASANTASSVQSSLLSKIDGSSTPPADNSGFSSGAAGVLDTGNGQSTTLGGTGIKAQVTQKVCGMVLQHAQSQL